MGRPRVQVNRNGKPVKSNTGVSYHKPTRRFYIVTSDGKRCYHKSWEDARAALALASAAYEPLVPVVVTEADYNVPLPADQKPSTEPNLVMLPPAKLWAEVIRLFNDNPEKFIARVGVVEYLARSGRVTAHTNGEGPALKQIGDAWREAMLAKHGSVTQHVRTTLLRWDKFSKAVGGPKRRVDALTVADFRRYHTAVADQARKASKSAKWYNDLCVAPKRVLNYVRRRYPDLGIPADVCLWADSFDPKPYQAGRTNATPVTPAEFAALLVACNAWAATDASKFDTATQSGRGKVTQARRRQRAGAQMEAIVRLALNCALDAIDIERLTWADLHLDGKVPYLDFARRKSAHKTGASTPRCTPLLPATVQALKTWQAAEGRTTGQVFASARKGVFRKDFIGRAFKLLKAEAGINGGLSFKHLRNCAPTIAYRKLQSQALADMVLGHTISSEARKYVGDPTDPTVLLDLVNEVGRIYTA